MGSDYSRRHRWAFCVLFYFVSCTEPESPWMKKHRRPTFCHAKQSSSLSGCSQSPDTSALQPPPPPHSFSLLLNLACLKKPNKPQLRDTEKTYPSPETTQTSAAGSWDWHNFFGVLRSRSKAASHTNPMSRKSHFLRHATLQSFAAAPQTWQERSLIHRTALEFAFLWTFAALCISNSGQKASSSL